MVSWGRFHPKFVADFPDHVGSQKTPFSIPLSRNSILNVKELKSFSCFWKRVTLLMNMLIVVLRWFYIIRNTSGISRRHRFFLSCTCVKVLFTNTFLKCRFRWKVEIISTFPLRTNVAFFLNQLLLSIHVNNVSHYNMVYSQSAMQLKSKI